MKRIQLSQNQFALVSDEWFDRLMTRHAWEKNQKPVKWYASLDSYIKSFYAVRKVRLQNGKRINEWMHRRVLCLEYNDKRPTDHLNHNTIDNQPKNLRIVTTRENAENQRNQSKYGVGIHFDSRLKSRPFQAQAMLNGKLCHIGMFATAKEAQTARKIWLEKHVK